MHADECVAQLSSNATRIAALFNGIEDEQARRQPAPQAWSMLDVICHLYDEEREDFRPRLDILLHHPETPFTPNDPEGWVTARDYQSRDFRVVLAEFMDERAKSVAWLGTLAAPDWQHPFTRPDGSTFHPGDMLASWVAHDFLHM
ncbi:MAG: DinB family protein, partial [Litorilinea sp.]